LYSENEKLKSTILYYPTIDIPNTDWLRRVLLYWDEIGSIVPRNYAGENSIEFSPEVAFLYDEGVFRPFDPLMLIRQPELHTNFEEELFSILESDQFRKLMMNSQKAKKSQIHRDKVSDMLFERLIGLGLASRGRSRDWLHFENTTAHVYISLLAKYLSQADTQVTIPGTDRDIFQNLLYRSPEESGIAGISFSLLNSLPMPREDVSFEAIIDFKNENEMDLLRFRKQIHKFQHDLQYAESDTHVREIVQTYQQDIRLGLDDLVPRFIENGLPVIFGSLKTIVNLSSPTLWGGVLTLANVVTQKIDIPLRYEIAGLTVSGLIQIGDYILSEYNKQIKRKNKIGLSYLLSAQIEGIL
jgi:hypothetical protein